MGDLLTKGHTADNVENAEALWMSGAIPAIIALLSDPKEEIVQLAIGVLRIFAGFEGTPHQKMILNDRENGQLQLSR